MSGPNNHIPGKFITIEGGDGAGKSTQLEVIAKILRSHEIDVVMTREPGGTPLGERLRSLLLDTEAFPISDDAELLLMFAARAEHVNSVIRPALQSGCWVVSDRFCDASFAYQGARGVDMQRIEALADWVLQGFAPDLTLLFDLPVEQGLARAGERGALDRFESEPLRYKQRVRDIYRARAAREKVRIRTIDASQDVEGVSAQVREVLEHFISS